jgi:hypothetical protein
VDLGAIASRTKASMTSVGIQGAPSRAVMSEGLMSFGWTARSAITFRSYCGSSAAAASATASLVRTEPDR